MSPAGDDVLEDERTPLAEFLRKHDQRLAKRHLRREGQEPLDVPGREESDAQSLGRLPREKLRENAPAFSSGAIKT